MHPSGPINLQQKENFISNQTPQASLHGYHSHAPTIEHIQAEMINNNGINNPHRRGNSNILES